MSTLIGIDPGWKNCGLAIVKKDEEGKLHKIHNEVLNPSSFKSITLFINHLDSVVTPLVDTLENVTIERFVAYAGIHASESENINMIIGALCYYFSCDRIWKVEPKLVRAIDWKVTLVKELYKKKGFNNPSNDLNKKFSIAAAKACLDHEVEFKTDHEADATCIACLPVFIMKGK